MPVCLYDGAMIDLHTTSYLHKTGIVYKYVLSKEHIITYLYRAFQIVLSLDLHVVLHR